MLKITLWRQPVLAMSMALLAVLPAFAIGPGEVSSAIKQAQFLPPGSSLNVRVDGDQVYVSTFKHSNEDKDCKIDATLIAKSVFDLSPEGFARVTCYFYGKDMSSCQEVSVSAGDIKSFASGAMTQEQLLASLTVKNVATKSSSDRIARQLESNWIARANDYRITEDKEGVTVTTALDSWVSDEDAKFEALRIAVGTFGAQPTAQKITVNFVDPAARVENREITFPTSSLETMWKPIQASLAALPLSKKAPVIELASVKPVKGPLQEEREGLLAQLREMEKKGIGVAPFLKIFVGIEQSVKANGDVKALTESISRLKTSIEDQLKRSASAKDRPKTAATTPDPTPSAPTNVVSTGKSRWAGGKSPIIPQEVLADPESAANRQQQLYGANANRDPLFANVLEQIAQILSKNGRAGEAAKFQQRAAAVRAAKP